MAPFRAFVALLALFLTLASAYPEAFVEKSPHHPKHPKCKSVKNQNYCNPHCVDCKNGVQLRKSNKKLNVGTVAVGKLIDEIKKQCYVANAKYYNCPSYSTSVGTSYAVGTGTEGGSIGVTFQGVIKIHDFKHLVALLKKGVEIDSKHKYECVCYDGNCPPHNLCTKEHVISDSYSITMPNVKDSNPFEISFTAHEDSGSACTDLTTVGSAISSAFEDTAFLGGVFSLLSLACN